MLNCLLDLSASFFIASFVEEWLSLQQLVSQKWKESYAAVTRISKSIDKVLFGLCAFTCLYLSTSYVEFQG